MRRPRGPISNTPSLASAAVLLAIALGGCGSSGSTSPATRPAVGPARPAAVIPLTSAAIDGTELQARYTCDGADIAPPLQWGAVPPGTPEVVLFALSVASNRSSAASSSVEWAMVGVKPSLHRIAAGKLPAGAVVEQASDGQRHYSICPPKGQTRRYELAVFAVPPWVRVGPHVSGALLLHNLTEGPPRDLAPGKGEISAIYKRS